MSNSKDLKDCSTVQELVMYLIDALEQAEILAGPSVTTKALKSIPDKKAARLAKAKALLALQPKIVLDKYFFDDISALEHEQWGHWTEYLINKISRNNIDRWRAQINTHFSDLSEEEKESDRKWARKVVKLITEASKGQVEVIVKEAPEREEVVKKPRKVREAVKTTKVVKK